MNPELSINFTLYFLPIKMIEFKTKIGAICFCNELHYMESKH